MALTGEARDRGCGVKGHFGRTSNDVGNEGLDCVSTYSGLGSLHETLKTIVFECSSGECVCRTSSTPVTERSTCVAKLVLVTNAVSWNTVVGVHGRGHSGSVGGVKEILSLEEHPSGLAGYTVVIVDGASAAVR